MHPEEKITNLYNASMLKDNFRYNSMHLRPIGTVLYVSLFPNSSKFSSFSFLKFMHKNKNQ